MTTAKINLTASETAKNEVITDVNNTPKTTYDMSKYEFMKRVQFAIDDRIV